MSVSEDALPNSFLSIEKKKRVFEDLSIVRKLPEFPSKRRSLFHLAKRLVPFTRIQGVM